MSWKCKIILKIIWFFFSIIVNSVILHKNNNNDLFDELFVKAEKILKSNPELSDEVEFLETQIEIVKENQVDPIISLTKRRKRSISLVNCTALQIQLQNVIDEISLTEIRIQNSTVTLNTLQTQVNTYQNRVDTTTGSVQRTNQNLLNIYLRLLDATITNLNNLNANLEALQAQKSKIESDIETYCTPVNPADYPCGKISKL